MWAFLRPVLDENKDKHPTADTIHCFSVGPTTQYNTIQHNTTQYRQKKNFYLLRTQIFEWGFNAATWNFHELVMGKGFQVELEER